MKSKSIDIPELKSHYSNGSLQCARCGGKMMLGVQYFGMKRSYIDLSCTKCARGVDVEVRELNAILREFGFKTVKERYVDTRQDGS